MNRAKFFAAVSASLFGGHLSPGQVTGTEALLDEIEGRGLDDRYTAYILATAYHETARTMLPIAEYGHGKGRPYGKPGRNHDQVPYGRGFVQTTWDDNYEKTDRKLDLGGRLIADYDLLLTDIGLAARAAVQGMLDGWYTGRKLSDFISATVTDFVACRRIINGTDKAALIAGYARHFLAAIEAAR